MRVSGVGEPVDTVMITLADAQDGSFRKVGGTLFWGPYSKDPIILGAILGSPNFRKLPDVWTRDGN